MSAVYLDYNATTPIDPHVQEAMARFLSLEFANPSSSYESARVCREAIEESRSKVADLLGANPDEIVFTASGSESNNLAIQGLAFATGRVFGSSQNQGRKGRIVISALEHPAVEKPARFLERFGFEVVVAPCDRRGVTAPEAIEAALRDGALLVSVIHANNEIGTVQPIRQIAEICRRHGVRLHVDASQSVGKIPTRVDELGADLLTVAGHKFYAPKGIGALYVRRGLELSPLIHGAGHERGLRAGTENTPAIVGLGVAASLAKSMLPTFARRVATLRDRLLERLRAGVGDGLSLNGQGTQRLPNTLSVNFPGVSGAELLRRAPDVLASTGSACHSGSNHLSPTLEAIGLAPAIGQGVTRLSLGRPTTESEIDQAANSLIAAWKSLTERTGAPAAPE